MPRSVDPFAHFAQWFAEAESSEPSVHNAAQIATVGSDGAPSLRTVLLKDAGPDGFVFYTNLGSRKAREIEHEVRVAGCLHWKSLQRQAIFRGPAHPVTSEDADAYFASRERGSQIGAWASRQSEPLSDRSTLRERLAEVTARFEEQPVPRPPFWSGFVVDVQHLELWQGRPDRLHIRHCYERGAQGWTHALLYP